MSYFKKDNHLDLNGFIARLAQELGTPAELLTGNEPPVVAGVPTIIEETGMLGRLNIVVIWDAWRNLSSEQRGHVIMQAYEQAKGPAMRTRIGLAMGLTEDQRQRIAAGAASA